jgi:glycosidase
VKFELAVQLPQDVPSKSPLNVNDAATYEFHVSRAARERYSFADTLFSITGNVVFADLAATREFADRMNKVRRAQENPDRAIHAGALNAMGLIDEALHAVVAAYREQRDPQVMRDALKFFADRLGGKTLDRTLLAFADRFPAVSVYRGEQTASEWLAGATAGVEHRAVALEELMMLWLANANPAFRKFEELFDETPLANTSAYRQLTAALRDYFETRPKFGPENQNLVDMLRAPALASPDSLEGQLAYIRDKWIDILGDFMRRLLTAIDILKEEELAIWLRFHPPGMHFGGPQALGDSSVAAVPFFGGMHEYERFSSDVEWMPRTVMIAKTVYVWLHQLSRAYGRDIRTLDQVPNAELELLARRGFNALWLIGVWERSKASQRIKQLTGNPEAAASAYSLHDYVIAQDLGGELAYNDLSERAGARGIRLASDMVPNHMGIDSRWVIEHPDWFLSLPYPPYPSYSFNGPDVASDGRVEIKIEDHYYERTDAAVVFRRVDRWTGDTRFIYHGNDGTSFPWNDTAQLNYLKPEVREAVIQTIIRVARRFPIIRFDAAMTLAKKHYQRLWFPAPGSGGGIPSRAEYGLTRQEFDAAIPEEFWREVVDRVAAEVPGTLLLAEAFWLLEGYFVRTLGMHRVYNSAFMNMLRDEENANYRTVIKNTIEFDPEILKRYVNFMNNPDERTAVDQFGKGDKYFGVCTMMATLPGLPMFGHGQIEGYTERYGMEYRRAYYDESPDTWLVARHEREISPLLHRRPVFAEVQNFLLYDFFTDSGHVNEDVFAYSNRLGNQRGLVVYHNRYADTRGWIRMSCGYSEKSGDGGKRTVQRSLSEGLGVPGDHSTFVAYRDAITGLEYIHRCTEVCEKGMRLELGAYKCHVFVDWRDMREDAAHPWGAVCDMLGGRGVPSLDDALRALRLRPVHDALSGLLDRKLVSAIAKQSTARTAGKKSGPRIDWPGEASRHTRTFIDAVQRLASTGDSIGIAAVDKWEGDVEEAMRAFEKNLDAALRIPSIETLFPEPWSNEALEVLPAKENTAEKAPRIWVTVLAWCALHSLGLAIGPELPDIAAARSIDGMRLREPIAGALEKLGLADEERWRAAARLRASFAHPTLSFAPQITSVERPEVAKDSKSIKPTAKPQVATPLEWLHDPELAWLINVHEYEGARYFNKEQFERLVWWTALTSLLAIAHSDKVDPAAVLELSAQINARLTSATSAQYRVEYLLEAATPGSW